MNSCEYLAGYGQACQCRSLHLRAQACSVYTISIRKAEDHLRPPLCHTRTSGWSHALVVKTVGHSNVAEFKGFCAIFPHTTYSDMEQQ